jgi:hypothetical protein
MPFSFGQSVQFGWGCRPDPGEFRIGRNTHHPVNRSVGRALKRGCLNGSRILPQLETYEHQTDQNSSSAQQFDDGLCVYAFVTHKSLHPTWQ